MLRFSQKFKSFALSVVLLLAGLNARAQVRVLEEGVPSSNKEFLVSTTTRRVDIATTSYNGQIPNVGLYSSSNVVISSGPLDNCVIYATGSISCLGSTYLKTDGSNFMTGPINMQGPGMTQPIEAIQASSAATTPPGLMDFQGTGNIYFMNAGNVAFGTTTAVTQPGVVFATTTVYLPIANPPGIAGAGVIFYSSATQSLMVTNNNGAPTAIPDPPGNWTCTVRLGSGCNPATAGFLAPCSDTVSCVGNEKVLGRSCLMTTAFGTNRVANTYGAANPSFPSSVYYEDYLTSTGQGVTCIGYYGGSGINDLLQAVANCCL